VFLLKCKACAAKDSELGRAHERELELIAMVKELQYAIHPARMTRPDASMRPSQVDAATGITPELTVSGAPSFPRGTQSRVIPPFVSGLQYGGHVRRGLVDDMRIRTAIERGDLSE
jgi:hypothetical protein